MTLTYKKYLSLENLLDLQRPRSSPPEHDETLFIIIHQTYELWFKQLLHEFDKIQRDFSGDDLYGAIHTFKRCRTIMKTLVGQLDILETMTPMSFTSFRDRLDTASGFQSVQYRELEFVLGYKRKEMLRYVEKGTEGARASGAAPGRPHPDRLLLRLPGPARGGTPATEVRNRDVTESVTGNAAVQDGIYKLYREHPPVGILFELMTDFDEGLQEWRYRHVMLVARTIGEKHGTGGSLGVEFLKKSLFKPVFPDLWAIRHRL